MLTHVNINLEDVYDDCANDLVKTPHGTFSLSRLEPIYLNGGRSSTGVKSRQSRFYYNEFELCKLSFYVKGNYCRLKTCESEHHIHKGEKVTLPVFTKKSKSATITKVPKKVSGDILFMSKGRAPKSSCCKEHKNGDITVWLLHENNIYRCVF